MGSVVGDEVGIAEATFGVCDGFDLIGQFVLWEVGVPFVVEGCASLGRTLGISVGSEGGNWPYPWFLDQENVIVVVSLQKGVCAFAASMHIYQFYLNML